jgi:hypothetical protein
LVLRVEHSTSAAAVHLLSVAVQDVALNPVEADVRITFTLREPVPDLAIWGRLVGPRCRYAETVEVAYPFRTLPPSPEQPATLAGRVIIPEPSFWEPTCPFLYEGPVELRAGAGRVHALQMSQGLRWLRLTARGLLWNGRPVALRGVARRQLDEGEALRLRAAGCNTVLASAASPEGAAALLDAADRLGFLVLLRLPAAPATEPWADEFADHPSFLGWVLSEAALGQPSGAAAASALMKRGGGQLVGVELSRAVPEELLAGITFVCCREELLPGLTAVRRPRVILSGREVPPAAPPETTSARSTILGWVRV